MPAFCGLSESIFVEQERMMESHFYSFLFGTQVGMAAMVLFTTPLATIKMHWLELAEKLFS